MPRRLSILAAAMLLLTPFAALAIPTTWLFEGATDEANPCFASPQSLCSAAVHPFTFSGYFTFDWDNASSGGTLDSGPFGIVVDVLGHHFIGNVVTYGAGDASGPSSLGPPYLSDTLFFFGGSSLTTTEYTSFVFLFTDHTGQMLSSDIFPRDPPNVDVSSPYFADGNWGFEIKTAAGGEELDIAFHATEFTWRRSPHVIPIQVPEPDTRWLLLAGIGLLTTMLAGRMRQSALRVEGSEALPLRHASSGRRYVS